MRLVMTLLVRDEEDILRANLDFHLSQGVDEVIVTDNASVDATPEILAEYSERGVVRVINEPSDDYSQGKWVTRMARLAATEGGADWVINSDADEFWWPREGTLRSTFEELESGGGLLRRKRTGVVVARRANFVPQPEDGREFWERMTLRETESFTDYGRPLPPKVAHRADPEITVRQGNHKLEGADLGDRVDDGRIEILHFPMRTYAQFENKIAKGGAAYARNTELPERTGRTWRLLYEKWQAGELREYWDANVAGTGEGPAGEGADSQLVQDERLRDYLAALEIK